MDSPIELTAGTPTANVVSVTGESAAALRARVQATLDGVPAAPPGSAWAVMGCNAAAAGLGGRWLCLLPDAILIDAFPRNAVTAPNGDGGAPAGAVLTGILLASGDSSNITKSGKKIQALTINGSPLIP